MAFGWIVWFPVLLLVCGSCIGFMEKVASFKISGVKSDIPSVEFCSHQRMYSFVCMTATVVDSVKRGLTFYYASKQVRSANNYTVETSLHRIEINFTI